MILEKQKTKTNFQKVGIENIPQQNKAIHKPTANIALNSEKLKVSTLGIIQGCPLSPFLVNTVLEVLAIAISNRTRKIRGI